MKSENEINYIEVNKKSWNSRLETHLNSDFYALDEFKKGVTSLNNIELELLGDIKGKSILHLQCHFGQDTMSLSRMGAEVTGVDFSEKSILKAKEIAQDLNLDTQFVCCNVYDLKEHLNEKFDMVFTSYGTISWLPDLKPWADIIQHFLKPQGSFVFAEFHPVVWMFDDDLKEIIYPYNLSEAIVEEEEGTYANPNAKIVQTSMTWNHGIGEVVNNLIDQGLALNSLKEYDFSPYPFIKHCEQFEPGKYRIKHHENKIPLVYSIKATKTE